MRTVGRRRGASAFTLVCALAVLTAPGLGVGTSYAAPEPQPAPGAESLERVRKEIDGLYRQAGTATDAYNLAESEAKAQSDKIVEIAKLVVAGQEKIATLKSRAGAAARAQYRSGGLPPGAKLALSESPSKYLDGTDLLRQGEKATSDMLSELGRTQTDLEQYAKDASAQWEKLEANRIKQEASKKEVEAKIKAAEELENKLEAEEKARLIQLEHDAQYKAQKAWLSSGAMKDVNGLATDAGKAAVQYATAQIGKPYVWGAEGPGSFDCSGLTSQAWRAAGKGIPRTSQEQLRLLPKVALKDMRPGDLIIYFDDATHVGMYVGDGAMVHAPRPGRNVTMAGAGSMPIKAVVRPDAS
ncbi:NlpC/P60 family protein [Streptomyces xanthophaeus]|uniref:Glycoside hydrolase n=1 Tax=Streptomyces xanthophaeus TaxID=67385 RepID=A0A919LAL0_9ACTN|nr:NlpC/P60 family protein [Streptomyces xanthophaeus]WCD87748.1 putative endopeptidase [Streptomyces xanthophaeus]WST23834.1 NlpC/P60 family protein [Streptomyces xanthophaeus]WST61191.1 NlpC/P60 family protein [Streptomyces xanthophaeus]GHI82640.1 glycoside hydrolase [Streptomyces xanthophaeus]GHI88344.1 glycoside hydrolase [Streptomyces xanthophaeus]